MFTERVIIFIFTGILSSYDKYGHDCSFKHEVYLNIWHYRFPAPERQIHLKDHKKDRLPIIWRTLYVSYVNILISYNAECSKYVYSPRAIRMQIGLVKVLEIQMLDN